MRMEQSARTLHTAARRRKTLWLPLSLVLCLAILQVELCSAFPCKINRLIQPRHHPLRLPPTGSSISRIRHLHTAIDSNGDASSKLPPVSDRNVELNTTQALIYDEAQDLFVIDQSVQSSKDSSYSNNLSKLLQNTLEKLKRATSQSFLPQGVNPSYYRYMKWRGLQRFVNSNLHVLGTQSLIMGLGLKTSTSMTAALTWVLKDALGKLTRLVWASKMGRRFDSDAKRWRFRASLVYALGNYLEIVTYISPSLFLLWAAGANSCKQVAMLTSSATRTALYNSFRDGKRENIADITAKGEAQIAVVDLIGISFGVSLSKFVGTSVKSVLSTYVVLQALEIFLLFREIRSVEFNVMNFERMAQVIETFCEEIYAEEGGDYATTNATVSVDATNGSASAVNTTQPNNNNSTISTSSKTLSSTRKRRLVPTPEEIAQNERIFLPPKHLRRRALAFGSMGRAKLNPEELARLMQIFSKDRYILIVGENVKNPHKKVGSATAKERIQQNCHIVLHEEATNLDILKSTLALFLLRRRLVASNTADNNNDDLRSSDCWEMLEEVQQETDRLFPVLLKQLSLQGWASPSRFMFGRVQKRAYWPLMGGILKSAETNTAQVT